MFKRNGYIINSSLLTSLKSRFPFNNSVTDIGPAAVTSTGTAITYAAGKEGNAAVFNGSTSVVTLGTNPLPSGNAGHYSISMWVKWGSTAIGYPFDNRFNATPCSRVGLESAGGTIRWSVTYNGFATVIAESGITPVVGQWYHIVITFSYNATMSLCKQKIYVDGVLKDTKSGGGTSVGAPNVFNIGSTTLSATVDAFDIWHKVLTSGEVTSLYNGGAGLFYPYNYGRIMYQKTDIQKKIVSAWRFENNVNDSFQTNHATVINNITYGTGKFGSCGVFNGTSSYATVPDHATLKFGNNAPFSMSAWIKTSFDFSTTNGGIIFEKIAFSASATPAYRISFDNANKVYFFGRGGTSTNFNISSTAVLNDGAWHFVVGTYTGTVAKLYVDGIEVATATVTIGNTDSTNVLQIGRYTRSTDPGSTYYNGDMDEVILYKDALTDTEINSLYAGGAGYLTPTHFKILK